MLKRLKKKIEKNNFTDFTNLIIKHDELIVSADKFRGYNTIKEFIVLNTIIDTNIYSIEHLNNNSVKIRLK